jgi:hypothetical protein
MKKEEMGTAVAIVAGESGVATTAVIEPNLRITEDSNLRITEASDPRITES